MKSFIPLPGILHLVFPTRKAMNIAMCRLSEFYESPSEKIRGKQFGLDELLAAYSDEYGWIDYFDEVEGHNIPGEVVDRFFELFELNKSEKVLQMEWGVWDHKYLIATDEHSEESTLNHELAHAKFGTDAVYKAAALKVVHSMPPHLKSKLVTDLLAYDVPDTDIVWDELQAYLATADVKELGEVFPGTHIDVLAPYIRALRALNGLPFDHEFEDEGPDMLHC
jgi:hypothetical protein